MDEPTEDYIMKIIEHRGAETPITQPIAKIAQDVHKNTEETQAFNYINSIIQKEITETEAEVERQRRRLNVAESFSTLLNDKYTQLKKIMEEARKVDTLVTAKEITSSEDILSHATILEDLRGEKISRRGTPALKQQLDLARNINKENTPTPPAKPQPKLTPNEKPKEKSKDVPPTPPTAPAKESGD